MDVGVGHGDRILLDAAIRVAQIRSLQLEVNQNQNIVEFGTFSRGHITLSRHGSKIMGG